jgi:hypothetical protein
MQPSEDPIVEQARLRHEARKLREEIAGEEKMLDEAAREMRRKWIWRSLLPGLIAVPVIWAGLLTLGGLGYVIAGLAWNLGTSAWSVACSYQIVRTCSAWSPRRKWLTGAGLWLLISLANAVLAWTVMLGTCAFFRLF